MDSEYDDLFATCVCGREFYFPDAYHCAECAQLMCESCVPGPAFECPKCSDDDEDEDGDD